MLLLDKYKLPYLTNCLKLNKLKNKEKAEREGKKVGKG